MRYMFRAPFLMILLTNFFNLFTNSTFAYSGFSVCNHGKETLPSVMCDGPAVLKQTTVKGNMNVTGKLYAEGLSVFSMTVLGDAELSNSEVNGQTKIVGNLAANRVNFKKGVAVESDKILLNHSVVNGTLIITSSQTTPYVQVQCSSVVKGAVLFDGKAGIVQVTGDSVVQGKIINGATEFVKRDCE